jgi:hypothetical protein
MHRPEYWGFVQFSTAPPATVSFRPDPAQQIRERLIDVYHANKRFQDRYKHPAWSADSLGLAPAPPDFPAHALRLGLSRDSFEAEVTFEPRDSVRETWTIDQESRITRRP